MGRSGLSGSKVKPHFHASLYSPTHSDPLQPTPTHSDPLHAWVAWVGVGCVGRSGLSGSKVKPHFHVSLIFFKKRQPLVFFYCVEFLFKSLHPRYPLQPLYTLHPIIINYSYFALGSYHFLAHGGGGWWKRGD